MRRLEGFPGILCLIAIMYFSSVSKNFLDIHYLLDSLTLYMEIGLLALGMTLIITSGNIDLSVGSNMVLTACLAGKLMAGGTPTFAVIPIAIAIGGFLGWLNGVFVTKLKLPSFLVTLGTMATYRGIAQAMLGPDSLKIPDSFKGVDKHTFIGLPVPVFLFVIASIGTYLLLHKLIFGRYVTAVGANESAALYSGISVDGIKMKVFALTGILAGIGALLMDSRLAVARHDVAAGVELDAITMVVVGGTSTAGGKGSVVGTVLALLLIAIMKTGMGVTGVNPMFQLTIYGALLVFSALFMRSAERIDLAKLGLKRKAASASE